MSDFQVSRFMMIETARYDDVYLRPYQTQYDNHVNNLLVESTDGGTNINPTTLAGVSNEFLQPSSVAMGTANLASGFGEKRFSYMMELTEGNNSLGLGGGCRYVFTGYTDHLGVVDSGRGDMYLDPEMKFYLNNLFTLRDTVIPTHHGVDIQTNMAGSKHILHNQGVEDYMLQTQKQYTLRPEDVLTYLDYDSNPMMEGYRGAGVIDSRNVLSSVKLSDRRFESRSHYLSDTIKSFKSVEQHADAYDDMGENSLYHAARDTIRDAPMSSNRFLSLLMAHTQFKNVGYVTYRELNNLLPELDSKAEIGVASKAVLRTHYVPGQGENWASATHETLACTIIQQMVPAIMSDCLLTEVAFLATNDTIGTQNDVRIAGANGFTKNLDLSKYLDYFIQRLTREILNDVSKNGAWSYSMDVRINLFFESTFNISLNGGPFVSFTAPAFCDGLYSPILSSEVSGLEDMAHDVGNMLHNITGDFNTTLGNADGGSNIMSVNTQFSESNGGEIPRPLMYNEPGL